MKATIKDIQRLTGFSLSTISKYLNGGNVLPENRLRIDKAVTELDFQVNEFARSLKTNRSKTVGLLIPELKSVFNTSIMADVEDRLRQNGYGVIVCDSRMDKNDEKEAYKFLLSKKVDGIIMIPISSSSTHIEFMQNEKTPCVLIDRPINGLLPLGCVVIDNAAASEAVVNEFASFSHKKIGIITGPEDEYTMRLRLNGFRQGLTNLGLPCNPELEQITETSVKGGYEGFKRLAAKSIPLAVYLVNYEITLGAIIAINELGLAIGKDISVIGFDNLELAQVINPRLTMIVQPMKELAYRAADLLLQYLSGDKMEPAGTVMLEAALEKGGSVARVSK